MSKLIEKARLGRNFALADLARSACRTNRDDCLGNASKAVFVSTRAIAGAIPHPASLPTPRKVQKPRWSAADLFSPLWTSYGARVH